VVNCVHSGVNTFVLALLSDDDYDVSLYEALKHCRELGALAVISADCHPSFTTLVSSLFITVLMI